MSKSVILNFGVGSLENGFANVTAELRVDGNSPAGKFRGSLPAKPDLQKLSQRWKVNYEASLEQIGLPIRMEIEDKNITLQFSDADFQEVSINFIFEINQWLDSSKFRDIVDKLRTKLAPDDEIRLIIETENDQLRLLPWHLWKFFEDYQKAEWALSSIEYGKVKAQSQTPIGKVRILVIIGDDSGLDVQPDINYLDDLKKYGAEPVFKKHPSRQELINLIRNEKWDILFFAGHSEMDEDKGLIHISQDEIIPVADFKTSIKTAITNGLQIAIFNSCQGLGLGNNLSNLDLPQMIVMREKVNDKVAQKFLRYFLTKFVNNESLYLSVRDARENLNEIDKDCLGASWVPVIYQNPTVVPPTWNQLLGESKPIYQPKVLDTLKDERYRLLRKLGQGSFGETYQAEDTRNENKLCAIKKLAPLSTDPKTAIRMFKREVQILSEIDHLQIPKFIDSFTGNNSELYLVEEYIEGNRLDRELNSEENWSQEKVINFLQDILCIIKYLHGKGVIHRDIKPSNLIRRKKDNKLVLIDFGAVKIIDMPFTNDPNAPTIVFTRGYTPSEQIEGKTSNSSDIYAVGIIAIQAFTRVHPNDLQRNSNNRIIWRQSATMPNSGLGKILDKMIDPNPERRYQSVEEVLKDLEKIKKPWRIYMILVAIGLSTLGIIEIINPLIRPILYLHQGNALLDSYKPEDALEYFDKILNIQPNTNNAAVWDGRGDALYGSGRYEGALESYKTADRLYPNNFKTLNNLGRILYKLSDYEKLQEQKNNLLEQALEYHEKALTFANDKVDKAEALSGQGIVFLALNKCQEASQAFDQARTETPNKPTVWHQKAQVLNYSNPKFKCFPQPEEAKRIYEEALAVYDRELKNNPNNLISWVDRGNVLNKLKRSPEDELDSYEQALRRNPDFYPALIAKGIALSSLGRYNDALETYNLALRIRPQDYLTLYNRGRLLAENLNQPEKALESFAEALKISPSFHPALFGKVEALIFGQKNYNEALKTLNQNQDSYGNDAFFWYYRGVSLKQLERREEALQSYNKAIAINPKLQEVIQERDQLQQELRR